MVASHSMKNVDVLVQAEAPLMGALTAGTGVTLMGLRLFEGEVVAETTFRSGEFVDMGVLQTAEIVKDDEGALVPQEHTAEQVRAWADGVFTRLLTERKSLNQPEKKRTPTGGTDPTKMGGAVVAQNLTRSYTHKSNSYWVGLMGGDIGARSALARGVRQDAMIAEQGGWIVGGDFRADTGVDAPTEVFHSRKKALKAAARAAYGKDWWVESYEGEKKDNLATVKEYILNAKTGENGYTIKTVAPAAVEVEAAPEAVEAEAPAAGIMANSYKELQRMAKGLGLPAGGKKAELAARIQEFFGL